MPKVDLDAIPQSNHTTYPPPLDAPVAGRWNRRLSRALGVVDFGISHVTLDPGAWSGQRHWHEGEDEFVVMLSGEAVLIEDGGETLLRPGDCVAYPKGVANAHHIVNRSDAPAIFVAMSGAGLSDVHYPDVAMRLDMAERRFTREDGSPFG